MWPKYLNLSTTFKWLASSNYYFQSWNVGFLHLPTTHVKPLSCSNNNNNNNNNNINDRLAIVMTWDVTVTDTLQLLKIIWCCMHWTTETKRGYWPLKHHSGDWLFAAPITAIGFRMSNETIRLVVGTRRGTRLREPHTCPVEHLWTGRLRSTRLVLSTKCRTSHQTQSAEHYMAQPVSSKNPCIERAACLNKKWWETSGRRHAHPLVKL